jgi:hypothetical protein
MDMCVPAQLQDAQLTVPKAQMITNTHLYSELLNFCSIVTFASVAIVALQSRSTLNGSGLG